MALGLYVHFPWCVRKCPYCDFNSHPVRGGFDEQGYVDRLIDDLEFELAQTDEPIATVYFGGGTPSLFKPESFARLLEHRALGDATEITMEANPGTIEHGSFAAYRKSGITRVSIGAQSFDPRQLAALGRIHTRGEARRAIDQADAAGFDGVNVDLMFGLPNQTLDEALEELSAAIETPATHISWYQLTIEPKTEFARRPPPMPTDDLQADMAEAGRELLYAHGYSQYEVSAFGRNDSRCAHNVNYWRFGDYIGIGAGAHGKATTASSRILRTEKPSQPRRYLTSTGRVERIVAREDLAAEFMMNALRLTDGVERSLFEDQTGLEYDEIAQTVGELVDWGLMAPDRLALTSLGALYLDSVVAKFIREPAP